MNRKDLDVKLEYYLKALWMTVLNKMELAWGTDDIPIGIFDDLELARDCAKRNNKKDFFKNKKSERNK